jgi:cysteinyl-tRNA synthetase
MSVLHCLRKSGNFPALHSALQFLGFRLPQAESSQPIPKPNQHVPHVHDNSSDTAAIQIIQEIRRRQVAATAVQNTTFSAVPPLPLQVASLPSNEDIQKLISARDLARKAKNFAESDRIRNELAAKGIVLKDSKDGTTWEIAR